MKVLICCFITNLHVYRIYITFKICISFCLDLVLFSATFMVNCRNITLHFPSQDSNNNDAPHQEQDTANRSTDEEKAGAAEQTEKAHEELQPQDEEQPQQEVKKEEEKLIEEVEPQGQEVPVAPAAEHGQDPVHVGQPEI